MRFSLPNLLAVIVLLVAPLTSGAARADMVGWDAGYVKQLQDSGKLVLLEFTSYR
jgi:hypothetical protein